MDSTTATPILPDVDLEEGQVIGDEILLDAAAATKVAKVKAGRATTGSRAWSMGGNVD